MSVCVHSVFIPKYRKPVLRGEIAIRVRDLIRENQVGWGDFRYEVRVYEDGEGDGEPLAQRVREFTAIDPDASEPQ